MKVAKIYQFPDDAWELCGHRNVSNEVLRETKTSLSVIVNASHGLLNIAKAAGKSFVTVYVTTGAIGVDLSDVALKSSGTGYVYRVEVGDSPQPKVWRCKPISAAAMVENDSTDPRDVIINALYDRITNMQKTIDSLKDANDNSSSPT